MWKTVSIFISSTFRDMHAERDHLENVVFLELKERLRERRCLLEPIDLRVGVETASLAEEQKELEVLKVCLAEIERSRPFLLVLLGDRYGWIPPEARIAAAAQEAGFMVDVRGRSVTALEIEYGILKKHPNQRRRSLFYFREPLPYGQMPPEIAARYSDAHSADPAVRAGFAKLQAFKARVQHDGEFRERVHTYPAAWDAENQRATGLAEWGNQVCEDLWRELDEETREFARKGETTWEEQERDAIEEFVEQRARDFVGREAIAGKLLALAQSPAADEAQWGVCVTGESGLGKSALFAHLHRLLSHSTLNSQLSILLLSHVAGISSQSVQVDSMLRRWTRELAEFLEVPFPLAAQASAEEIENAFASLLSRASMQRRVLVLIDALNQFEPTPRARHLTWLPKLWPANARLIATAIPGDQSDVLARRPPIRIEPLSPLNLSEAETIALKVAQRYHRTLNPQVLAAMLAKKLDADKLAAGNPLWLELALEQLNQLDEDDYTRADREFTGTPEQRLLKMVLRVAADLPPDIAGLYEWMLTRTEKVFGLQFALAFADLIALSRFGWRESDFRVLLPAVAKLLSSAPLTRPSDTLSPSDGERDGVRGDPKIEGRAESVVEAFDPLRFAQLRRGFRAHIVRRGALAQWDFFHAQTRLAVHRRNLADPALVRKLHSAIAEHLESLSAEDPLRQGETMFHLISADDRLRAARYYGGSLDSAAETCSTQVLTTHILALEHTEANSNLDWVISMPQQPDLSQDEVREVCNRFQFDLNDALVNEGRLSTRLRLLEATHRALLQLEASDPSNAEWQRDVSVSFSKLGNVQLAQGDLAGARLSFEQSHKLSEQLAASDRSNSGRQRDVGVSFSKLGDVQLAQGDLAGARLSFEQSHKISEQLAASDPSNSAWQYDLGISFEKLGDVQLAQGDLAGARLSFEERQKISQKLAARDPSNAAWQRDLGVSFERLGDVQLAQGDLAGARLSFEQSHKISEQLAASDPSNSAWQYDLGISNERLGNVLLAEGKLGDALKAYQKRHEAIGKLAASDSSNAEWQRDLSVSFGKLGKVQLAQEDLAGARVSLEQYLKIAQKLVASDPSNAEWQSDLSVSFGKLGEVQLAQGDLAGASGSFEQTHKVLQKLAASDPSNAGWQRNWWVSCWKMADLSEKSGTGDALAWWRKAYEILSGMKQRGLFISPQDEQVLAELRKKVGNAI